MNGLVIIILSSDPTSQFDIFWHDLIEKNEKLRI